MKAMNESEFPMNFEEGNVYSENNRVIYGDPSFHQISATYRLLLRNSPYVTMLTGGSFMVSMFIFTFVQ